MVTGKLLMVISFLLIYSASSAIELPAVGTVNACFTPGENCTAKIVNEINGARQEVLLQAYEFTSTPIARALVAAARRGVRVVAIMDKSQRVERSSKVAWLLKAGVPVYIDELPAIAHSKIIIIDRTVVATGSFNFTTSAQERNAENLLILSGNTDLAMEYVRNFAARQQISMKF